MICIYHSKDLDGQSSAAIIKKRFNGIELIGYDYGDPIPVLRPNDPLIIVDVSFPMDIMLKMSEERQMNLTWIDHHIKSIREYERFMKERKDTFCVTHIEDGLAACELTWEFLYPDTSLPKAISLLGMYDVGRKTTNWETEVLPFQFGMRAICSSPEEFPEVLLETNGLAEAKVQDIIRKGNYILQYIKKTEEFAMKRGAFEAEFLGMKALCLNASSYNFFSFSSQWDNSKHEIAVGFYYDGQRWLGSIYTDRQDIDCNELARRLGGGGHKKAAGFVVNVIFSEGFTSR